MQSTSEAPYRHPTPLQRQLLNHLDRALSSLTLFEEDPRAAAWGARTSIERAAAILVLLRHLDPAGARRQRRALRSAWRLLGPLSEHRSRLRPDAPPPLAPAARDWVRTATDAVAAARDELDLPCWRTPPDRPSVEANAVATYVKAQKRWQRETSDRKRAGRRQGPSAKLLRAARRLGFQTEALVSPETLTNDARHRAILTSDLARWFSLTPAEHRRWLREVSSKQDQADSTVRAHRG